MRFFAMILVAAYSVLMLVALKKGSTDKVAANGILSGCILNLLAVGFGAFGFSSVGATLVIAGMVCISLGTLINGIRAKKVHPSHHILRFLLEAVIVLLFLYQV